MRDMRFLLSVVFVILCFAILPVCLLFGSVGGVWVIEAPGD